MSIHFKDQFVVANLFRACQADIARRMTAMFKEYMEIKVHEHIAFEDLDAYYAPGECGNVIAAAIDRDMDALEKKYNLTVDEMEDYWGMPLIARTLGRLIFLRCPFCNA